MNLRLAMFRAWPRWPLRSRILRTLCDATAAALDCESPCFGGLSYPERMRAYATFTASGARDALQRERDVAILQSRLRRHGRELGLGLRDRLGVVDVGEAMAVARVAYGTIGIDFAGDARGRITIRRCYFSRFYTPDVCRLISALDEGVLAGLAGDGRLTFQERITEGAGSCRACFTLAGARP